MRQCASVNRKKRSHYVLVRTPFFFMYHDNRIEKVRNYFFLSKLLVPTLHRKFWKENGYSRIGDERTSYVINKNTKGGVHDQPEGFSSVKLDYVLPSSILTWSFEFMNHARRFCCILNFHKKKIFLYEKKLYSILI